MKHFDSDADVINKYYRERKLKDAYFRTLDFVYSIFFDPPQVSSQGQLGIPKRLLLVHGGHLGDTIVLMSLLPILRQAFPSTEIGLLTGSWNSPLLEGGEFDHVHYIDHWYANRARISILSKIFRYAKALRRVVREVKKIKYDIAINLRPWLPNLVPIIWFAGISTRLGFDHSGFTPLLTHYLPFRYDRRTIRNYFTELLSSLSLERLPAEKLTVPWIQVEARARADFGKIVGLGPSKPFAILHMMGGSAVKNWREDGWRGIAERIVQRGMTPVFTGVGADMHAAISRVTPSLEEYVNACDKLSIPQLAAAIEQATVVISVDTFIGHLAAALGTPCVSIYGGMQDRKLWQPIGKRVQVVTHAVLCSPCFNNRGCAHMSCLQNIEILDVDQAIDAVLQTSSQ